MMESILTPAQVHGLVQISIIEYDNVMNGNGCLFELARSGRDIGYPTRRYRLEDCSLYLNAIEVDNQTEMTLILLGGLGDESIMLSVIDKNALDMVIGNSG